MNKRRKTLVFLNLLCHLESRDGEMTRELHGGLTVSLHSRAKEAAVSSAKRSVSFIDKREVFGVLSYKRWRTETGRDNEKWPASVHWPKPTETHSPARVLNPDL